MIKTDAKDAEALATLLRLNCLPTSYVPPREVRDLRELVRLRAYLVRERTRFKNKIWAELAKRGIRLDGDPFAKKRWAHLQSLGIPTVDRCLRVVSMLDRHIREMEREVWFVASVHKDARLLMNIPGIGYFAALTIVSSIGDVSRFQDPEKLCSYAGLDPLSTSREIRQRGDT